MKRHTLRISAVLIVLALFSAPAAAMPVETGEAFTLSFSAETCSGCWPWESTLPDVTIEGLLTVVPVTGGSFWDPWFADYAWHSALMVTGISGTLSIDCMGVAGCVGDGFYSLSYVQANPGGDGWSSPLGDGSYLLFNDLFRYVVFSAEGSGLNTRIINDNAYNLFQWASPATGYGTQVPIQLSAVQVPEPSSLSLLAVGFVGVTILKSRQRKRSSSRS